MSTTAMKWNSNLKFPRDNFVCQCVDETFGPSSKDNPMITLEFEVVSPETAYNDAGELIEVVGVGKIKRYYPTKVLVDGVVDEEKSAKALNNVQKLYEAFGLPFDRSTFNVDNPASLGFKGKLVWCDIGYQTSEKRKSPTAEQLAKGQKQGDVRTNPVTGEKLLAYWPQVSGIFGLTKADAGKPF